MATFFLSNGVENVNLVEVFPRFGRAVSKGHARNFVWSTGLSEVNELEGEFARRMGIFNTHLEESAGVTQGLHYLKVQGFHFDEAANFRPGGLHLNSHGRERLRLAIRKTTIVQLLRCHGSQS